MIAFISDIHANLEALNTVLKDIKDHAADRILCLGDIVGYGPDPERCTDLVMERAQVTIVGNHDYALIHGPVGFNYIAAGVIYVTRQLMCPKEGSTEGWSSFPFKGEGLVECTRDRMLPRCFEMKHSRQEQWDFIDGLPETHREQKVLLVHGSPLVPIWEYVLPDRFESARNPERLAEMFERVEWLSFCGHTHFPCAISSDMECIYPIATGYHLTFDPKKKYIVNLGSVGQPRDGDNRASYVLYDEKKGSMEWRRLPYDIEAVVAKIAKTCGIDSRCGARLRLGK
jgi:diadenosine tetraphosphatase ApaH/serine/threonine PP2A family protein phosphatase